MSFQAELSASKKRTGQHTTQVTGPNVADCGFHVSQSEVTTYKGAWQTAEAVVITWFQSTRLTR